VGGRKITHTPRATTHAKNEAKCAAHIAIFSSFPVHMHIYFPSLISDLPKKVKKVGKEIKQRSGPYEKLPNTLRLQQHISPRRQKKMGNMNIITPSLPHGMHSLTIYELPNDVPRTSRFST